MSLREQYGSDTRQKISPMLQQRQILPLQRQGHHQTRQTHHQDPQAQAPVKQSLLTNSNLLYQPALNQHQLLSQIPRLPVDFLRRRRSVSELAFL